MGHPITSQGDFKQATFGTQSLLKPQAKRMHFSNFLAGNAFKTRLA